MMLDDAVPIVGCSSVPHVGDSAGGAVVPPERIDLRRERIFQDGHTPDSRSRDAAERLTHAPSGRGGSDAKQLTLPRCQGFDHSGRCIDSADESHKLPPICRSMQRARKRWVLELGNHDGVTERVGDGV